MLSDGCGLPPGSRAAILLRPHWQTAVVLLGCWAAGVAVSYRPAALAGLSAGPGADEPFDASFVSTERLDDWLENVPDAVHRYVLGLAPGATPVPELPAGYLDYVSEVVRFPDGPLENPLAGDQPASVDGTSMGAWGRLARETAQAADLRDGDRVLVDAGASEQPLRWLLAPLTAGASIVLCANVKPERRDEIAVAEGVTRIL